MIDNRNRPIDEIIELIKQAKSLKNGLTAEDRRKFKILFARRGFEPGTLASLRSSIAYRQLRESLYPELFDTPGQMQGEIILGKNGGIINRYEIKYAPYHCLGVGHTGSGKSVLMVFLLLQFMMLGAFLWVFDFVKRELRGLKKLARLAGYNMYVCRFEWLRINPLDPQQTDPALFANICSEFLTMALAMPPVAKLILKICITQLYEKSGLFINPGADPPNMDELINKVQKFEGNKAAREAILIRLKGLLANTRQIFSVRRGMSVSMLGEKLIVWEFDGIEATYQNLIASYLLAVVFLQRVQFRSRQLLIVAFDEASGIYSRTAELTNQGPSYITKMTCTVRKLMIGILAFTQTARDLSHSIIANSGLKILFQVGSAQDHEIMGKSMGMDSGQIKWAQNGGLKIGTQIIKTSFGWPRAFINKSPLIEIPEDVSDTEVRQSCRSLLDATVPAVGRKTLYLPDPAGKIPSNSPETKLTKDQQALYQEIQNNPSLPSTTEHYRNAGLSTKRGNAAKTALIKKQLVKETLIDTGRRGGRQIFLSLIKSHDGGRTGNALHKYISCQVKPWYLQRGCTVEPEQFFMIDSKKYYTDLAIKWPDGRTEAVEIETGNSTRVTDNITKNILYGFGLVTVIVPNSSVGNSIKKTVKDKIDALHHDRIRILRMCFYK